MTEADILAAQARARAAAHLARQSTAYHARTVATPTLGDPIRADAHRTTPTVVRPRTFPEA